MTIYYVTVAGAGAKDGSDWSKAFGLGEWETHAEGSAAAGDFYYVEEGTYTLSQHWDATGQDATAALPITVIGVKSGTTNEPPITSDWADAGNRPLIAAAAYTLYWGDHWIFRNLRSTITSDQGFKLGSYGRAINCYSNNSSGSARDGFRPMTNGTFIDCEGISTNGDAINVNGQNFANIIGCYLHDSDNGVMNFDRSGCIIFSIIDTCATVGIEINTEYGWIVMNNTIYNCATGIDGNAAYSGVILNNIISDCTTGIAWDSAIVNNHFDYNNYYNNTADTSNVTKGVNATAYEPQYTGAAGGDFSLNTASSCIGAAFSIELGV